LNSEKIYNNCTLCPRNCGADRTSASGFCGESSTIRAARAGLHLFEEPFISGKSGSGTVFFSGCSTGCIYCQNFQISRDRLGFEISTNRLAEIFLELQDKKASNINLVTGTHFTPSISEALRTAKQNGLTIPVLWNSSGYEKPETLHMLEGLVDIFMPDFKTMSAELGARYMNAPDYPYHAREAVDFMVKIAGKAMFTEPGLNKNEILMRKGVLVRHLIIPGHTRDSMEVIRYLYETYGDTIWISIMNQYTPVGVFSKCQRETPAGNDTGKIRETYPELTRSVTNREYDKVVDYALSLGIKNCMIQEGGAVSESFIPSFDGEGL